MNKWYLLLLSCLYSATSLAGGWFFRRTSVQPRPAPVVQQKKLYTIMLDPAGDAQHPGRIIFDTYEQGIALQYVQELKRILEQSVPQVRIISTRNPGESLEPLHQATFANRMQVDLYLSFHFYQEQEATGHIFCYYYVHNPITDLWHKPDSTLALIPFNQAYKKNLKTIIAQAQTLCTQLISHEQSRNAIIHTPQGIPFRPLLGIQSPACAFEFGLTSKESWKPYVNALAESIRPLVKEWETQ